MGKIIYTTDEVAKLLDVNKTTVKRWADKGKIHCERTPGQHRKFTVDNIMEFAVKNNYHLKRLQQEMVIRKDSVLMKRLAFENNGNYMLSVIISLSLKGQKHEIVTIFYNLYNESIPFTQIVCSIVFPVILKIERLLKIEKINEKGFVIAKNTIVNALVMFGGRIEMAKRHNTVVVIFSFEHSLNGELQILESKLEVEGYLVFNLGILNTWIIVNQMVESYSASTILCLVKQTHNQNKNSKDIISLEHVAEERDLLFLCGTVQTLVEMNLENAGKLFRSHRILVEDQFEV